MWYHAALGLFGCLAHNRLPARLLLVSFVRPAIQADNSSLGRQRHDMSCAELGQLFQTPLEASSFDQRQADGDLERRLSLIHCSFSDPDFSPTSIDCLQMPLVNVSTAIKQNQWV